MATPKTIAQLTERSGALQATDEIEVQVSGETKTKKKALSAVKTFVIGSATVGGNAAGDIVTTNGTQTLVNKTMISPVVGTACTLPAATTIGTVTAVEILKLAGLTPSTAELNYVDGVTSAIQTQLDTLAALIGATTTKTFTYGTKFTAAGSNVTITQATILATLSGITGYLVNPQSIIMQVFSVSGATYSYINDMSGVSIAFTTTTGAGVERLSEIKIGGLTPSSVYCINISFKLVADPT